MAMGLTNMVITIVALAMSMALVRIKMIRNLVAGPNWPASRSPHASTYIHKNIHKYEKNIHKYVSKLPLERQATRGRGQSLPFLIAQYLM